MPTGIIKQHKCKPLTIKNLPPICYRCDRYGHWSKNCKELTTLQGERLIKNEKLLS